MTMQCMKRRLAPVLPLAALFSFSACVSQSTYDALQAQNQQLQTQNQQLQSQVSAQQAQVTRLQGAIDRPPAKWSTLSL
jgi:peptidoglycan hydrolase CwlO-like protein